MEGEELQCQRCEARIEFSNLDLAGWLVRHAWEDGVPLVVWPDCQRPDERRIVAELRDGQAQVSPSSSLKILSALRALNERSDEIGPPIR